MSRLFGIYVPQSILLLLISDAFLIAAAFALAAYVTLPFDPAIFLLYENGILRILLVMLCLLLFLHLNDLYTEIQVSSRTVLLQQLCMVLGGTLLIHALVSYVQPDLRVPIRIMIFGSALTLIMIYLWRVFYSAHMLGVIGGQRLLVVGGTPLVAEMSDHLDRHPELGMTIVGYVGDDLAEALPLPREKALGPIHSLMKVAEAVKPDRIILALSERRRQMPIHDLLELRYSGYLIEEASRVYEAICGRVCTKEIRPSQFIFYAESAPRSLFFQWLFNSCVAAVGIILTLPLMLLSAIAVRLSSPGPALYRQERVGLDGVPFTLYKFRSMYVDAEARTGAVWATKNDPRITPVGKWLRQHRLDELPQLFNVLRGDMSIVGPRPERPKFVEEFGRRIPYYAQRHSVHPGITGWAQINYKYADTFEDTIAKLEYDLYYIQHMSLALDLYIIFQTVKAIFLTRGAQ